MVNNFFGYFILATLVFSSLNYEGRCELNLSPGISGNEIFDSVIENLINGELRNIPVPDLHRELRSQILMIQMGVSLRATQGHLGDLTSVRRVSDVMNRTSGDSMYFAAAVTLDHLHVVFHNYRLRLGIFHKTGDRLTLHVSFHFV